jgi:hypothetical protein
MHMYHLQVNYANFKLLDEYLFQLFAILVTVTRTNAIYLVMETASVGD